MAVVIAALLTPSLATVSAQDRPAITADKALENSRAAYGPPPPKPKCDPQEGDEIVVCAEEQEQSQFRVKSSNELDPTSEEAIKDGLPRAPDLDAPPCKPSLLSLCVKTGRAGGSLLLIDVTKLPQAPKGSDADRISKGEIPAR